MTVGTESTRPTFGGRGAQALVIGVLLFGPLIMMMTIFITGQVLGRGDAYEAVSTYLPPTFWILWVGTLAWVSRRRYRASAG